jgi:hypothetical protein
MTRIALGTWYSSSCQTIALRTISLKSLTLPIPEV